VHLCLTIAPTVLISEFIGQLNGASSHEINQKLGYKGLEWKAGYGVVSFGTKGLPWVRGYVRDQKERHASGRVEERLERITEMESPTAPALAAEAEQREAP
jgi:REP element-mobilizing transposase RayT